MNKEEESEAMYRFLFQLNQTNYEIIRKYRKKMKNVDVKLLELNKMHHERSHEIENENLLKVNSPKDSNSGVCTQNIDIGCLEVKKNEENFEEIHSNKKTQEKCNIRFPNIHSNLINSEEKNSLKQSENHSRIIASQKLKVIKEIKLFNEIENVTINENTDEKDDLPKELQIEKRNFKFTFVIEKQRDKANSSESQTQSIRKFHEKKIKNFITSQMKKAKEEKLEIKSKIGQTKALLNLQEIVFDYGVKEAEEEENRKNKYANNTLTVITRKQKLENYISSTRSSKEGILDSLNNITNLINKDDSIKTQPKSQYSSVSVSSLAACNFEVENKNSIHQTALESLINNTNIRLSAREHLNYNIENITESQRLKEFKINFQKNVSKKEVLHYPTNYPNCINYRNAPAMSVNDVPNSRSIFEQKKMKKIECSIFDTSKFA